LQLNALHLLLLLGLPALGHHLCCRRQAGYPRVRVRYQQRVLPLAEGVDKERGCAEQVHVAALHVVLQTFLQPVLPLVTQLIQHTTLLTIILLLQ
jgi:hypothetical protein